MKTTLILVLILVSLSQALPIKDNTDDDGFIPATEIDHFHLLTFLQAVMSSNKIQWEVMRNWLKEKGILKLRQPKKKLKQIRLF